MFKHTMLVQLGRTNSFKDHLFGDAEERECELDKLSQVWDSHERMPKRIVYCVEVHGSTDVLPGG